MSKAEENNVFELPLDRVTSRVSIMQAFMLCFNAVVEAKAMNYTPSGGRLMVSFRGRLLEVLIHDTGPAPMSKEPA